MKKISITGSSGFIGKYLKKELTKNKFIVKILTRKDITGSSYILSKKINSQKPDIFIHLAASTNPGNNLFSQINGTIQTAIKTACSLPPQTKLAIYFGSIEEYGPSSKSNSEKKIPTPNTIYGWSKYISYLAVKLILNRRKIPLLWVRPSLIFGLGASEDRLIGQVFKAFLEKKSINLKNPCSKRDFLFIEDLTKVILYIIKNPERFKNLILNISSENYLTVEKFSRLFGVGIALDQRKNISARDCLINSNKLLRRMIKDIKFTEISKAISSTKIKLLKNRD